MFGCPSRCARIFAIFRNFCPGMLCQKLHFYMVSVHQVIPIVKKFQKRGNVQRGELRLILWYLFFSQYIRYIKFKKFHFFPKRSFFQKISIFKHFLGKWVWLSILKLKVMLIISIDLHFKLLKFLFFKSSSHFFSIRIILVFQLKFIFLIYLIGFYLSYPPAHPGTSI